MKRAVPTPKQFREFISTLDNQQSARYQYCYHLGSTFVHVNRMEDSIIWCMSMCDRVKVKSILGEDASNWDRFAKKLDTLQGSTLGSLISILSRHNIQETDLQYLRWLKGKRDLFIHRIFREGAWPGNLSQDDCAIMIRRLCYLELIFMRGSSQIWKVLQRAGLMHLEILSDGMLAMNLDFFDE
ncbi:MAG: hypothetical protein ACTHNN_19640 [Xanthobacteraceae bacterium]